MGRCTWYIQGTEFNDRTIYPQNHRILETVVLVEAESLILIGSLLDRAVWTERELGIIVQIRPTSFERRVMVRTQAVFQRAGREKRGCVRKIN